MLDKYVNQLHQDEQIRPFEANRIALVICERTAGKRSRQLRKNLERSIAQALFTSLTKVTRLLNNTDQPTAPELAVIAQVLRVSANDLIQLQEAAK